MRIEGELKEVEKFKKENVKLDFDKYIPYPKEFTDKDKQASKNRVEKQTTINGKLDTTDGYNSGGYEWCIQNWGTKWGAMDFEITNDISSWEDKAKVKHAEISYTFNTAWSPPIPVIEAMSKKYPKLNFDLRYFERGMGFNGIFRVQDGKVEMNEEGKYYGERGG